MLTHLPRSAARLLVSLALLAPAASAVEIEWVTVGAPGSPADSNGDGFVPYAYDIAKYEVSNAQYAEFLNAVAANDPNGLYNANMGTTSFGGISRSGSAGSYAYSVVGGRGNWAVNYVSFYDSLRFVNWLHNGQPTGAVGPATTEGGAYTISAAGISANSIVRNPVPGIVLANDDEWYKAAYYDVGALVFWDYPTASNTAPTCSGPTAAANRANCDLVVGTPTDVGAYPGSLSAAGTLDQAGNVFEWNETILQSLYRGMRGGTFELSAGFASATGGFGLLPDFEEPGLGFRVASVVPEPGTSLLLASGLLALALRRSRARR